MDLDMELEWEFLWESIPTLGISWRIKSQIWDQIFQSIPTSGNACGNQFPLWEEAGESNPKEDGSMPGLSLRMHDADSFLRRFWLNYSAL